MALGEVMLRLDPGEGRIRTTRAFQVWEGGGEYNVARGLRRCFGQRAALVTALADNDVGRLLEDLILQGGVDTGWINWIPYDGVGRAARNGLNFTERGFGVRGAIGCSDRGHTAAAAMSAGDVDWDRIFGTVGARWFHTGGIFAALSETTAGVAAEAMQAARRNGVIVSYDLNYRPSLWKSIGGPSRAAEVNRELVQHVDVLLGNEEDFSEALGFEMATDDASLGDLDLDAYAELLEAVMTGYPRLEVVATTLRQVRSATVNDWSAVCMTRAGGFAVAPNMERLEILDRVGGGDSFASGFFYGLLNERGADEALAYGVAHGALAMTTPGDTSMATLDEVERLRRGASPRVQR
ncbi:MAG TPA: sugar kinase [Gaiellaceae bacterium]|nr:sugar kinase [Gaiellaceae bacterium]